MAFRQLSCPTTPPFTPTLPRTTTGAIDEFPSKTPLVISPMAIMAAFHQWPPSINASVAGNVAGMGMGGQYTLLRPIFCFNYVHSGTFLRASLRVLLHLTKPIGTKNSKHNNQLVVGIVYYRGMAGRYIYLNLKCKNLNNFLWWEQLEVVEYG